MHQILCCSKYKVNIIVHITSLWFYFYMLLISKKAVCVKFLQLCSVFFHVLNIKVTESSIILVVYGELVYIYDGEN